MKRTKALRLVLLGGGIATMLAACGDDAKGEACQRAKAELRPDAEEICRRSSGSGSGGGSSSSRSTSWSDGRTASSGSDATSARGGFGGVAHGFSGGG